MHGASRQVAHRGRLVDDLLDVSRTPQGKTKLKFESVDLGAAIDAAIETVKPAIGNKHHRLIAKPPSVPTTIRGDAVRIAQVIGNVLFNAAKYTPRGGIVEIWTAADDSHVFLHVRDNGVGIAPKFLPHIFEFFCTVRNSIERSKDRKIERSKDRKIERSEDRKVGLVSGCRLCGR
jgi:two-component system, sensor histidine kinase